jgi:hypothetical protein
MNYWDMQKETLCKYADTCEYYRSNRNNLDRKVVVIRNIYCRSKMGWEDCVRFTLYSKNQVPLKNVLPNDKRSLERIEEEIRIRTME